MSRTSDITDNIIESTQSLDSIRYYKPTEDIPSYSDYPLNLLTPILARRISAGDEAFIENEPHKHAEFELLTVRGGSVTVQLDNSSIHVLAGDSVCIRRGVVHSVEPDVKGGAELEITHFHHGILFGSAISTLSGRNLAPLLNNKQFEYRTFDHQNPEDKVVIDRIRDVYSHMQGGNPGSELRAISALYDIWGILVEMTGHTPDVPLTRQQALDKQRIERATEYIAAHYFEDILLSDISKVCGVSDSECCRSFQRALHSSPIDYINRYRIYAAAEIMTNDTKNIPMSDVAAMVGFNYASYFNKTFKRYLGMTPMQYRKKYNKAELYRSSQQEFRI